MGTADEYSVLAGTMVTNTGATALEQSLGVAPGPAVTGFPPGVVVPPAMIESNTAASVAAQLDLTTAYDEAAARPLNAPIAALGGQTLVGGVYAAPLKAALSLTGNLILDGAGDPNSVFVFQTDTTLITAALSTITLINGAQECNVFWQVGSSATLGAGSTFVGSILALTAITVGAGVTVRGRALARNAAVTLDSDTFSTPGVVEHLLPRRIQEVEALPERDCLRFSALLDTPTSIEQDRLREHLMGVESEMRHSFRPAFVVRAVEVLHCQTHRVDGPIVILGDFTA